MEYVKRHVRQVGRWRAWAVPSGLVAFVGTSVTWGYCTGTVASSSAISESELKQERGAHSPKGNLSVELAAAQRGAAMTLNVTVRNRSDDAGQVACATTILDDLGEVWVPETIDTRGIVESKQHSAKSVEVSEGLPDGYYRAEVTCGLRPTAVDYPGTLTQSLFFRISSGKWETMSHESWLQKSAAMIAGNTPAADNEEGLQ